MDLEGRRRETLHPFDYDAYKILYVSAHGSSVYALARMEGEGLLWTIWHDNSRLIADEFDSVSVTQDGTVEKVPFGLSEEPGSFPLSMGLYAEVGISPHFWWVMDHVQFYARASQTIFFSPLDDKYSGAVGISRKLRTVSYEFGIRIPFWFIRD